MSKTTFEKSMENPEFRKSYEEERESLDAKEELLKLIEERKLSYRELAKMAGLSKTTVQKFQKQDMERIALSTARALAQALGRDIKITIV